MIGHKEDEASVRQPAENDLVAARDQAVEKLLRPNSNIVGIGIGKKVKNRKTTSTDCVRVYVVSKKKEDQLTVPSMVPHEIGGVPTDVIEIERFGRKGHPPKPDPNSVPRPGARIRVKTKAPNVNEGVKGTVAAVVTDGANRYILSCNHILAVNGRVPNNLTVNGRAPYEADLVLAEFVGSEKEIAPKMTYRYVPLKGDSNSVDCAIALLPGSGDNVQTTFPDGERLSSLDPITPVVDTKVTKYGAITGRTYGNIVDTHVVLYVDYTFGTFLFRDQVMIDGGDTFAFTGDSGSLVVDTKTGRASAMIFAASGRFAVACPLKKVLEVLKSTDTPLTSLELAVD